MHNQNLGRQGEEAAKLHLEKKGYRILEQNWRHLKCEVDMICVCKKVLVFVEVKTRSTLRFGYPEEAVGAAKEAKLAEAASAYIELTNHAGEIRFDIVSVVLGSQPEIHHIEDAFFPGL